jgi:hypothetical protein
VSKKWHRLHYLVVFLLKLVAFILLKRVPHSSVDRTTATASVCSLFRADEPQHDPPHQAQRFIGATQPRKGKEGRRVGGNISDAVSHAGLGAVPRAWENRTGPVGQTLGQ